MNIGDVWIAVKANLKGFDTEVVKEATKTGDKAGKAMSQSMGKSVTSKVKGGVLQGLGLGAGLGVASAVTAGVSAMTDEIFKSIDAASDLAESQSKVGVVFEKSADKVRAWSETAAESMGLSQQAALEASSTIGNLLLSMGKTSEEAATMSMRMVQLAADIGSFNNVPTEDVLLAIRSGLTGEIAPLRRFGINLTEAALKQEALNLGLSDGKKVLDASAKSAAAYSLILKQTGTAQGDFERTSDGLANTQKILSAQLDDIRADIGEELLPVMLDLALAFKNDVLPAVKDFIQTIKDNQWIFDFLSIAFDAATHPMDTWSIGIRRASADAEKSAAKIREMAKATDEARHAALTAKEPIKAVGGAYEDTGDGAIVAAESIEEANTRILAAMGRVRDAIFASLHELVDDYYGEIRRQEESLATRQELAALRRKESLGKLTEAEKARMLELEEAAENNLIAMAEKGEITSQEFHQALDELRARAAQAVGENKKRLLEILDLIDRVTAKSQAAINKLKGINKAGGQVIAQDPHHERRATGGPADAGSPYRINEATPRSEYFVPSVSGRVVTHAQAAQAIAANSGAGSGGMTVNIGRVDQETMPDVIRRLRRIDDVKRMRTIWS